MKLNVPYHSSRATVSGWSDRYLHSNAGARPLLLSRSAGFIYMDKCGMVRVVYGLEFTIDETTGQLIEILTSCSSTDCIALKFDDNVMKVVPVLINSDEVPPWAITSLPTIVLDLAMLTQNNIDITSLGLKNSVKIALIPLGVATTYHTGEPVDNLNMAEQDDISRLSSIHGLAVAVWAATLDHALKNRNFILAHQVLAYLKTAGEDALQLGPKAAEFEHCIYSYEPTLMSVSITNVSHPHEFSLLLDRLGGPEKQAAPTVTVTTPASPSFITILDKASEKEEVLYKSGNQKNKVIYIVARISKETIDKFEFAIPTAAMASILAMKTGDEKSEGMVSLFDTNATQQKRDPNNEYNSKIQCRDNDHYEPIMGTAFLTGNVSSSSMDNMNKSSNKSSLSIVNFSKQSKAVIESLQQENQRQLLEAAIGESETNSTKKRTTFHPVDFFRDLSQVGNLMANFMSCVEAAYQCPANKQPLVYQVAEIIFKFCIDKKTVDWYSKNSMPALPMFLVCLMDELYASCSEAACNYTNRMAVQANRPEDLDTEKIQTAGTKVLHIVEELTKKRGWGAPWPPSDVPAWIRNMTELKELEAGSNDCNARSISPNKRTFDKTTAAVSFAKTVGDALPSTSGSKPGGRTSTSGRGTASPTVSGQVTQPPPSDRLPLERGRLRESDGGGSFTRPPNRNGCYLLQGQHTNPDLALCTEARSQYCGHHAVVHKICGNKECKLLHKWWHEYSEELKTKQLQYMDANPTVVKFTPKAAATIRALPSGVDHLIGGEN